MKAFELVLPASLEQALAELPEPARGRETARESVKLLAGGQDLLGELKEHLVEPERVVDLKRIPGLERIEPAPDGSIGIGALATVAALGEDAAVARGFAVLREAALSVASPQIRNVGTVGGNLCQRPRCWYYRHEKALCLKKGGSECFAHGGLNKYNAILGGGPSYIVHPSDLAPALVALGAEVTLRGKGGERTLALERFFTLPSEGSVLRENVLASDEILTRVKLPAPPAGGWRSTYVKFKERGSYDFALASVALALSMQGDTIREARLCLGGVAPIPWRVSAAEAALAGRKIDAEAARAAGEAALKGAEPLQHNAYKIPLAKALVAKALLALAKA
ncbi:MAG TPA: xanthine dehydrogenase family protein subunit M [Planctomycetota bacterium]|nr:xanthine dehydrogenase family protein subunit M [Planctomycetota bacterium]